MAWSGVQRAFLVESFIKNGYSYKASIREFKQEYNINFKDPVPSRNAVNSWVAKFRSSGTTLKKSPPGRNSAIRTPENVAKVKRSVQQSPMRSARKHALVLGIARESVRRILHFDLKFHPYKMMVVQELLERDYENRKNCSEKILEKVSKNSVLITSDEAHFHLNGFVNKQNFRYWSEQNPCNLMEQSLHCKRVTVWCAVGKFGVWGPYFFEENDNCVSVNSSRYCEMLLGFLKPKLPSLGNNDVWFQQDGATAHTAAKSLEILKEMFPSRLISIRGDISWPARSPDLAPCDFFLWGYLKEKVYQCKPRTIEDLKERIKDEINNIPPTMLNKVMESFETRLKECIANGGRHLNDTIFKS